MKAERASNEDGPKNIQRPLEEVPSTASNLIMANESATAANSNLEELVPSNDNFWQLHGFGDQIDVFGTGTDLDLDSMLAQDFVLGHAELQGIDWAQWDTWLADSDLLPSMPSA